MTVRNEGQRWWAAGMWAVVLTLFLGACSSGPPSVPSSSSSAPPSQAPQTSATPTPSVAAAAVAFCNAIKDEFALLPELVDVVSQQDSTRRRSLLAEAKKANDKIIATAPADQKRDVELVIGAANAANAALTTSTTIPPAVKKRFTTPEYRAASARVRDYVQNECHIDVAEMTTEQGSGQRSTTDPASSPRPRQ